jgi:class 3 adenylate cyclase
MAGIPSGTVTFLFTDIEGSTKLAQEHPEKWETL